MTTIVDGLPKTKPPYVPTGKNIENGFFRASLFATSPLRVFLKNYDGVADVLSPGDTYGETTQFYNIERLDVVLTVWPEGTK